VWELETPPDLTGAGEGRITRDAASVIVDNEWNKQESSKKTIM
jgi:hypothetical protein